MAKKATVPEVTETPVNPEIQDEITNQEEATVPEVTETPVKASKFSEPKIKHYSSPIYLNHKIGGDIKFVNGSFSTADAAKQRAVESDPLFGAKIFFLK